MGSTNVTSGAYHESTMGLKKEVYSLAKTRLSLLTVAANDCSSSSVVVVVDEDAAEAAASVVDMKSWVR